MRPDEPLGVQCPGCGDELTIANAGGHQAFCEKCVAAMPPFPKGGFGCHIEGTYPSFVWVCRRMEDQALSYDEKNAAIAKAKEYTNG